MTTRPASAARSAVRLTRRGRVLLLLVLCGLLLAAFSIGRVSSHAAGPESRKPAPTTVVHAGDTLWGIAQRVAPHEDPRVVVLELQRLNRLPSAAVEVGQRLVLPRR